MILEVLFPLKGWRLNSTSFFRDPFSIFFEIYKEWSFVRGKVAKVDTEMTMNLSLLAQKAWLLQLPHGGSPSKWVDVVATRHGAVGAPAAGLEEVRDPGAWLVGNPGASFCAFCGGRTVTSVTAPTHPLIRSLGSWDRPVNPPGT